MMTSTILVLATIFGIVNCQLLKIVEYQPEAVHIAYGGNNNFQSNYVMMLN